MSVPRPEDFANSIKLELKLSVEPDQRLLVKVRLSQMTLATSFKLTMRA